MHELITHVLVAIAFGTLGALFMSIVVSATIADLEAEIDRLRDQEPGKGFGGMV